MISSLSRLFVEIGASQPRDDDRVVLRRAVVLGGSMAGLLAARVLSGHAEEVVIIERDDLSQVNGSRAGVPQSNQVHALLNGGRIQLDRWFPGFTTEIVADGAVLANGENTLMYRNGVRKVTVPDQEFVNSSRPFLEAHVRRHALSRDNVRAVPGRAQGLVFAGDRVIGVRYSPTAAGAEDAAEATETADLVVDAPMAQEISGIETLTADLVVDAMGRSSRLGDWLEQANWPQPALRRMNVGLNYAAAVFRRGDELPEVRGLLAQTTSDGGHPDRAAALVAIEGDRWLVGLGSYADDRPSQDREDFLLRCQQILAPDLRTVVEHCDVVREPATYHQADSRRREFHRLDRFPAGLLVVGDALASFNPIYGQGMTSATLHASCLSSYLRSMASVREPAWDYFRRARVVVDAAWQTSTLADLALPHVTGPYPRGYRIAQRLSDVIVRASITDVEINRRFLDVVHMRAHPNTLVRPGTLLRAARVARDKAVPANPS